MMRRDTRILFFTKDVVPTEAETDLAYRLSNNIGFRNAGVSAAGSVERADAVAALEGTDIPGNYVEAYPTVASKADVDKLDKEIAAADKAGLPRPVGTRGPLALDNEPTGPASRRPGRKGATPPPAPPIEPPAGGSEPGEGAGVDGAGGEGDGSTDLVIDPVTGLPVVSEPATTEPPVTPPVTPEPATPPATPSVGGPPAVGGWNPNA